jgi:hypothetical protein
MPTPAPDGVTVPPDTLGHLRPVDPAAPPPRLPTQPAGDLDPPAEPDRADAVAAAFVHSDQVAYSWYHSMTQLLGWDMAHQGRVLAGGYIGVRAGTGGLVEARNKVVGEFLADGRADWLWWVDTDMGFPADTIDRLLEAADPVDRPIVGALCFIQSEFEDDGMGGWHCRAVPTVYDWVSLDSGEMGWATRWDYPLNTLVRVGGTGSACILIHRSVFERIADAYGPIWYDRVPNTTAGGGIKLIGEDLSFCLRAGAQLLPMFVHTGVGTSHLKRQWVQEADYWPQMASLPPPSPLPGRGGLWTPPGAGEGLQIPGGRP